MVIPKKQFQKLVYPLREANMCENQEVLEASLFQFPKTTWFLQKMTLQK